GQAMLDEALRSRVRRDRARTEPDLVKDDVLDRALRIVLADASREGVVKVRADRRARAGGSQRVTRAARRREQLLAVGEVGWSPRPPPPRRCRTWRGAAPPPRPLPPRLRPGTAASTLRDSHRRHGLLARGVDREHLVEAGDLEDLRDVAVAADQRELAVVRPQPLDAADEHAERRRVDERRAAEVDDDVLAALTDHLDQLLLELGRRVEVDLARERDDITVAAQLL